MAEAIPPIVWEPGVEEGGVLLIWAGWVELVVLVLWGPEEVLEELEVWEEEEEATAGLRWDSRELSKVCSDRYGAERGEEVKRKLIIIFTKHLTSQSLGFNIQKSRSYLDRSGTLEQRV